MLSVAFTDLVQMIVIMVGMLYIALRRSRGMAGGAGVVIEHAAAAGKLEFLPELEPRDVDRLRRRVGDDDARLDSAAGRVPARRLGEEREAPPATAR